MSLPPNAHTLMPSLRLDGEAGTVTLAIDEFRRLIEFAVRDVIVDEGWYIAQYPDIGEAVQVRGSNSYATEHYRAHGYLEGRLPHDPIIDEEWYKKNHPDVDEAIRLGHVADAKTHFITAGYFEGRKALPDEKAVPAIAAPVRVLPKYPISRIPPRPLPK
jgi:hypothetical protein